MSLQLVMNIALFIGQFPKISETFILNQIDGLLGQGHEVTIFPMEDSGETKIHTIVQNRRLMEQVQFPPKIDRKTLVKRIIFRIKYLHLKLKYWHAFVRLEKYFYRYQGLGTFRYALSKARPVLESNTHFDVAFAHFGPNGMRANWYRDAGLIDCPLTTIFHGFDLSTVIRKYDENLYQPLFASDGLFLPISSYWKEKLISLGSPVERTMIHHVGIDCEQFLFRKRSRKKDAPTIFISVARLVEKKGIEYAIKAFSRLRSSGRNFNFHYRIVGDGPLFESLQELVVAEGLQKHILFLGTKTGEEVIYELLQAHIFLAPSVTASSGDMEGIPTVLMEAMATGSPVISTYHSGIPELVEDGVSGKLVQERDITELANVIETLSENIEAWPIMGHAGREKVFSEFNIKKLNVRLEELFNSAIQKYPL